MLGGKRETLHWTALHQLTLTKMRRKTHHTNPLLLVLMLAEKKVWYHFGLQPTVMMKARSSANAV